MDVRRGESLHRRDFSSKPLTGPCDGATGRFSGKPITITPSPVCKPLACASGSDGLAL
jgi:hypothetical protein